MQEMEETAMKTAINQWLKLVQWPSLVRMGVKMVKERMVAVGRRMLSRAVPLRIMLSMWIRCDSSAPALSSSLSSSSWPSIRTLHDSG